MKAICFLLFLLIFILSCKSNKESAEEYDYMGFRIQEKVNTQGLVDILLASKGNDTLVIIAKVKDVPGLSNRLGLNRVLDCASDIENCMRNLCPDMQTAECRNRCLLDKLDKCPGNYNIVGIY